ncbi:hypothetical protein [Candidatus Palauibacter sp.]|uniref:hypothetical protein n=1 Tax=Candidatus Palauibacter sp. TaxID=3101350 RepID=UPI003CC540DC
MRKVTKSLLTVGLAALAFGACGDTVEVITPPPAPPPVIPPFPPPPPPPPPVNQAPQAVGSIPALSVAVGATTSIDVAGYFSDADGDALTFSAGSSNAAAATVSMDGSNTTVTGVADGTAVITVTARDPDGAAAAQGVSVTVGRGSTRNQPPQAVGQIPAHAVGVGATTTVDVAGYFSDPDGDELSYTPASSNADVAAVAMEGTATMITGVADGTAVITITARDPSGEAAAQGLNVTVGRGAAGRLATVAIVRLRPIDGQGPINTTDVSGDLSVLLNIESNDETWTGIQLLLDGEPITPVCRGVSSSDRPVGVELAQAGAQVEIECLFNTDAVLGECAGMQLDPQFPNDTYDLGARLVTTEGENRDAEATQRLTLNNSNFIMVEHNAGSSSLVGEGVRYYGGPTTEANTHTFDACPVAYEGTVVGALTLETSNSDGGADLTFMTGAASAGASSLQDDAAPFTWTVHSKDNAPVESTGYSIANAGPILDADGVDVRDSFVSDGVTRTTVGIFAFDFRAPRRDVGGTSRVWIAGAGTNAVSYSDAAANTVTISGVNDDGGVGWTEGTTSRIDVGDCALAANADADSATPFVPAFTDVTHLSDLPEDDADDADEAAGAVNGLQCYVAEVHTLTDDLGNATDLATAPIRSRSVFGNDQTAPVAGDLEPAADLVLNTDALTFVVSDPDLESGDAGTGVVTANIAAADVTDPDSPVTLSASNVADTVTVDVSSITTDGPTAVDVTVPDGAVPANETVVTYNYVRDQTVPVFALASGQEGITAGIATSVVASISGTITDANVVENAVLSVHAGGCGAATEANKIDLVGSDGADPRINQNDVDLTNGTSSISYDESFTIVRADVLTDEDVCFQIVAEDEASAKDGTGGGNTNTYQLEFKISP